MTVRSAAPHTTRGLRKLIDAAMELERLTMELYCLFEGRFARKSDELRSFWFDMAQHESRHFGALALVGGLLDSASQRSLPVASGLTPARIRHLRKMLMGAHAEASRGVSIERAFAITLEIEGSEIEDVVLDLLQALKGEAERERAAKLLIHDLGDLSYMIEKYSSDAQLLARADALLEQRVGRLRSTRQKRTGQKQTAHS